MITTQYIKNTVIKPVPYEDYEVINVLKWNNSKWKTLCPYYLRTDGNERCYNPGNILFENFYQGLKVYDVVYNNDVYASKHHMNDPKYLWWSYKTINKPGDILLENDIINYELYYNWRDSLWSCEKPIRYPNKIFRRKNTQFALCVEYDGTEIRMDYETSRKEMYVNEYIRLIKNIDEYQILLNKLQNGQNIMICEIDVPANFKKSEYGNDCDENNICNMSIEKLEILLNDTNEAFGHGLCLAYSLLLDLKIK